MRTPRLAGGTFAWLSPSISAVTVLASAGAALVACSPHEPAHESEPQLAAEHPALPAAVRPSPEAVSLARSLKTRFPALFSSTAAPLGATVRLPARANQPLSVRDDASKVEISVVLDSASAEEAAAGDDLVVYAGAAPGGGDLVHRAVASGVEDLVHYAERPGREALTYHVDVRGAAGLRLVGDTLEMLDSHGAPVLRAAAPFVLDAAGRHEARLTVEGCAVDTSPEPPFHKKLTPPGGAWCAVTVDWSAAGVRYPALVDPVWGTTLNTMATPRAKHTLTLLNPTDTKSLALVAGGVAVVGGAPLKSAEIYDPLSRRFSVTGSLNVARSAHSATLLTAIDPPQSLGPQEPVLIAGGQDAAGAPIGSLEVYDPTSGTFVLDANIMAMPRFEHIAVLVADDAVLIAGGTSPPQNQPTNTAYVYTFIGFGAGSPPPSVMSTLVSTSSLMVSARTGLAASRLTTGKVLLTGGFVLAGGALQALQDGELYNPLTATFSPIQPAGSGVAVMATQRGYHTSTALGASGTVLIAGGLSKTVNGLYTNTVDLYLDGSKGQDIGFLPQPIPITMASARANHTATLLPDGRVLVAGGFSGSPPSALSSAEIFSPVTKTFSDLGALVPMQARGDHAALLVNAGDSTSAGHTVLVTGGSNAPSVGAAAIAGAQILLRLNGDPCTLADECLSGFCTDGVCCNELCDQECYACSKATKQGAAVEDGICGFAMVGSDAHVQCINQVETHTECDGNGSTQQTAQTHSCLPAACGSNGFCSPGCAKTPDCDVTGWCDLTMPGPTDPGTCQPRKPNGTPCYGDDQCVTLHCVDGVCCETSCDKQCQACDVSGLVGQCQFLGGPNDPQDVHPNLLGMSTGKRDACLGFEGGERTACTGACVGKESCENPGPDVFLKADDCKDDPAGGPSTLTRHPCNSDGGSMADPTDCKGSKCADEHSCKSACETDADCVTDFVCLEKKCTALTGPLCDGEYTLRQKKADGGYQVCADHFACPDGATACLTQCSSINDCKTRPEDPARFVCNGEHKCVTEPSAPELPSCAAAPSGGGAPKAWWLVGLAALVAARRRRRA